MGGMQIDFSRDTAMELLRNVLQIQQNQQGREGVEQPFIYILLNEYLRAIDSPSIKELTEMGGPRIWKKYSRKLENKSLFFSQVFLAVAEMLEFN
jgi:hypothetical protein